jgi:hypothetical protein
MGAGAQVEVLDELEMEVQLSSPWAVGINSIGRKSLGFSLAVVSYAQILKENDYTSPSWWGQCRDGLFSAAQTRRDACVAARPAVRCEAGGRKVHTSVVGQSVVGGEDGMPRTTEQVCLRMQLLFPRGNSEIRRVQFSLAAQLEYTRGSKIVVACACVSLLGII